MTPRAQALLILLSLLALVWLGIVLTNIHSELRGIRQELQLPRASFPGDAPAPGPSAPRKQEPLWTF